MWPKTGGSATLTRPASDLTIMTRRIITALAVAVAMTGTGLAAPAAGLARTHHLHARHHRRHVLRRREGPLAHIALL
jgi:hypothetical protein